MSDVLEPYGGDFRFTPTAYEPQLLGILQHDLRILNALLLGPGGAHEPALTAIKVTYTGDVSVNAVATAVGEDEYVAIYVGTRMRLWDTILALFACESICTDVGQLPKQRFDLKTYLNRVDQATFLDIGFVMDPARLKLVETAALMATMFVFGHEIGHLVNGHLRFLHGTAEQAALLELSGSRLSVDEARTRRLLELDADYKGVAIMLRMRSVWMRTGISESRVFYLLGLALNVLFRVFDRHGDLRAFEQQSTHPLPDLRFFHAMFVGLGYLQHHEPSKARGFEKQVVAAARDVESVWSEAQIDAPSFERWRYKPSAHVGDLIQEVEQLRASHLYALRDRRIEDLRRRTAV